MRILSAILVLCCTLSFAADLGSEISDQVSRKMDAIGDAMEQAALNNDYDTILSNYTDDVIIMADFQEPIRGKSALRAIYKSEAQRMLKYHAFSGKYEKRWEQGGYIYEYGSFGMTVSTRDDKKPSGYYGSYFQICEPVGTSYKVKYVIWNLDHNPY